ncbi:cobalt ECF transporter T component CbiQ [Methanoregula sp.]|uniref:cobalt ECF transporter T component CbiQ n=1 Tax=Methanoregula sp. TaxID=2052170 RepID=UPI002BE35139|nr:cobalt ECF transporter T component CbiQ [Methanoregula sp.]HVP97354.1 cobalt ECF transporter T component CbiQ [Methanoregula sp.]
MLPEWMQKIEAGPCACCTISTGRKKGFVQKAISDIFIFFEECLLNDNIAQRKGLLQSLDPRVKLISMVILIFAVAMTRDIRLLVVVYILTLIVAYLSRIELWFFLKRVWVFIPIFAGIIMIPILFNIFTPGDTLITIANLGPDAHLGPFALPAVITITRQGVMVASLFVVRVATCVSAAVLLFLTTPRDLLFKSLRSLKVPKVYILTLDMCYRYIFLFSDMIKDFYTAKKSRSIRALPLVEEQKWVGSRVGYTLVKALSMSEKVHGAMISRGFSGDIKIMHQYALHRRDYVACVSVCALSIVLLLASQNLIKF